MHKFPDPNGWQLFQILTSDKNKSETGAYTRCSHDRGLKHFESEAALSQICVRKLLLLLLIGPASPLPRGAALPTY